jgi:glutamyl-tRNA synthetase
VRGRYAPSPTGEIHLGNASSALLAWLSARAAGSSFVMRMEDIDRARVRAGLAEQILADLRWLGLDWDEGPDCGGPHRPYDQSARMADHERAFERLRDDGRLYPCFCSRRDIAAAASAPQNPGDELRYPGTCRDLDPETARQRVDQGDRHAWRFRVCTDSPITFTDRVRGKIEQTPPGDFVIRRTDAVYAYQLVVVEDDHRMQIAEVVRGNDLLTSTARQLLLLESLGYPPPAYAHVPLLVDSEGVRLSKRQQGITLRELRDQGKTPDELIGHLAHLLRLCPTAAPIPATALVDGFDITTLATVPTELIVEL